MAYSEETSLVSSSSKNKTKTKQKTNKKLMQGSELHSLGCNSSTALLRKLCYFLDKMLGLEELEE